MKNGFYMTAIFVLSLLFSGGFPGWSVAILGFVLSVCLFLCWRNGQCYRKGSRWVHWIPELIFLCEFMVSFWAIDGSGHLEGIMRSITILLWFYICLRYEPIEREELLYRIPEMGVCIVFIGAFSLVSEKTKMYFWTADRFGGIFQYANTCALFLLIGLQLCYYQWQENRVIKWSGDWWKRMAKSGILLMGLFMTGSRSVLLLGLAWGILYSFRDRRFRKPFLCGVLGVGVLSGGIYKFMGAGTQNISRIFTILSSNSTLYGRLLYNIDGASILLRHPMGLGYLGYYYVQRAMQTGVYTIRYIHNDILQIGLDYGMLSLALFGIYMTWQLVRGKQPSWKKELIITILAASLTDFHMQYIVIDFIIVLCLDLGERAAVQKPVWRVAGQSVPVFLSLFFLYLCIPCFAGRLGKYQTVLRFLPGDTVSLRLAMADAPDLGTAAAWADRVLERNVYIAEAYNVKAYTAAMQGDIAQAMLYEDEVLRLEKYNVDRYRAYDRLLEHLKTESFESGEAELAEQIERKQTEIRDRLEALRGETSPLAYKLRDVPVFTW